MKNILIADDHEIVRRGIKSIIDDFNEQYNFFEGSTCKEIEKIFAKEPIDYIVLDMFLVDGNAFSIVDRIIKHHPGTGILIYTMNAEKIYGKRFMQKGVRGFVCKQASVTELEQAIKTFLNDEIYMSAELQKHLRDDTTESPIDSLSDRELEVVEYLSMGMGAKEISNQMNIDISTVSTFRRRALEKLGVENNVELKDKFLLYKTEAG